MVAETKAPADRIQIVNKEIQILRDNDLRCAELEASGYVMVAESWGAWLRIGNNDDMASYADVVKKVLAHEVHIKELGLEFAGDFTPSAFF